MSQTPVLSSSREVLEPWYLTGLVESAGAFTFSKSDRNTALYFGMKHQGAVLEDVQAYFGGAGRIYGPSATRRSSVGATQYYRVCRLDDLERVVMHFDAYPLRGRKAKAFLVWREMVFLKRGSFRQPNREHMAELCTALTAASSRNRSKTTE